MKRKHKLKCDTAIAFVYNRENFNIKKCGVLTFKT